MLDKDHQSFEYCLNNHISFHVGDANSFISSSSQNYDIVIYDVDKFIFARGEKYVQERTSALLLDIDTLTKSPSTCNSLIILLSSLQSVSSSIAQDMKGIEAQGWKHREFFHIPELRHLLPQSKKSLQDVNAINDVAWVRAVVLSQNLTWNNDYEIKQCCATYFGDKYCQPANIISAFEVVPSGMRMVDKTRHSPHPFVKPSSTVNNILCKFFPHISSLLKPSGRIPKVLCIDSGIFIIPMDLILNFGVNIDILERSADAWDSWCLKPNSKYETRDNNMKSFSSKINLLFREIVNEGQYKKILMNPKSVSNIKETFKHLLTDKSISSDNSSKASGHDSPYCSVCGSCDVTVASLPPDTCIMCSKIETGSAAPVKAPSWR